jgi:DNA (cytosine-5)-methyltransferase 1
MRVLDLFAGCGGLSLGFSRAGYQIAGAVELDDLAAKSHAENFFKEARDGSRSAHAKARDITKIEAKRLIADLGLGEPHLAIDVIAGGPPCQAYARVGRAKLREIAKHPEAFLRDPRSNLYLRFLNYVEELQPLVVLIENVPDAINHGGHNIAEETCEALDDLGYEARYTLLNSVFYGVPQMRERMFLLAYAKELKVEVEFPEPTHWIKLPRGYEGTRSVALKTLEPNLFRADSHYVPPPETVSGLAA